MEELWKDIVGYEGLYQVSNFGNIKILGRDIKYPDGSIRRRKTKLKKILLDRNGYPYVYLTKDSKSKFFSVHRLVALHFIEIPESLIKEGYTADTLQINHKDEVKTNNRADNLEWCTAKYNINYGTGRARAGVNISKAKKGKKPPKEVLEALANANRGRHHSEETKRKIGLVHKGKKVSKETIAKRLHTMAEKGLVSEKYL